MVRRHDSSFLLKLIVVYGLLSHLNVSDGLFKVESRERETLSNGRGDPKIYASCELFLNFCLISLFIETMVKFPSCSFSDFGMTTK